MKDSIIFNWPSGASGDFLLTIYHLIKYGDNNDAYFKSENRFGLYNLDNIAPIYDLVEYRGIGNEVDLANNISKYSKGYLIHSHVIKYDVPESVTIINIDDTNCEYAVALLYYMKRDSIAHDFNIRLLEKSPTEMHKLKFAHRPNFKNYAYEDIFYACDKNSIINLYMDLGIDVTRYIDTIVRCIKAYTAINNCILRSITVKNIMQANYQSEKVIPTTIEELLHALIDEYKIRNIKGEI